MDLALTYNPTLQVYDLAVAGTDLAQEDTLASAVLASLLSDRLAQAHEVEPGQPRRGWWGDTYPATTAQAVAAASSLFGSRLWLLEREKQIAAVVQRCKLYCEEALRWLVQDGWATEVAVTVFTPRMGWLVAQVRVALNGASRLFRFEFDGGAWRLAGEGF